MPACTIIILTYKGMPHLKWLLPTVQEAIANYNGDSKINVLIVDNGCDEITRQFSQTHFPQFRYEFSPVNDYLFSLNAFIRELSDEYLLMLNDDMKMEKNILNELIPLIQQDSKLFAVTCRIMDFDGSYTVSAIRMARYSKGWMYNHYLDPTEDTTRYTLYPGGGAAIFRTSFFNALGGFDTLYRPAYSEDVDLGIRAWQRGWKVIYHPKAILYHREGGTISDQFKKDSLEQTIYKNQVLCMIKNIRYSGFLFWFYLLLPYRIGINFFLNRNIYKALIKALKKFPLALVKRRHSVVVIPDEVWIAQLNLPYVNDISNTI